MNALKKILGYFSVFEWLLWSGSTLVITLAFVLGGEFYPLTLIASLVGVTALIFLAKGNVLGQALVVLFSILYAAVSYSERFYGEMITYVGMTLPSAVAACVSWLKNPSGKGRSEVKIAQMTKKKWVVLCALTAGVTAAFYFVLKYFDTNNLPVSTLSVATSFFASMLTVFRSPYYALAYAANDLVLIGLWSYACFSSLSYLPMVVCFVAFLFNDGYGFFNWRRMQKKQMENFMK